MRHDFEFSFVSGGSSNKLQNWTWSAVNICPVLQAIQSSALYGIHPSARDSMKGSLREDSFTGDCKRYVKQGSEMGVYFHMGPAFGEHGGALLS